MCEEAFFTKAGQEDHVYTHTGERPYVCEFCQKTFANRNTFWAHRSKNHLALMRKTEHKCSYCPKTCFSHIHLQRHEATHTGERVHKCPYCEKEFFRKCNLTIHIRLHTGETPFHCSVCPKKFRSRKGLVQHNTCHCDAKPYECGTCGNSYKGTANLKKHMKTVHGIRKTTAAIVNVQQN